MKQTNFLNCRLSMGRPRFAKPLGFTVVCLGLMFILGTQNSAAQSMTDIGEVKTSDAFELVQAEMEFLAQEMKDPSVTVNADKNFLVYRYYENVIRGISKGEVIRKAFMSLKDVTNSDYNQAQNPHLDGSTLAVLDLESSDYQTLAALVLQLDLSDNNDSDLVAIFDYWRTLKNQ